MGETFENRDLGEAVFRGVNLYKAVFDDVNLGEATIHNANLTNLSITDANIRGLTILGMRVDLLIEAELDRRDPERGRLRMADPCNPEAVRAMMDHLDAVRSRFFDLLRAADIGMLMARPSADK